MWENRLLASFSAVCAFWLCADATGRVAQVPIHKSGARDGMGWSIPALKIESWGTRP
ncbi:MAG: hypothetical protein WCA21_04375 [Terracidiphilus sp.]